MEFEHETRITIFHLVQVLTVGTSEVLQPNPICGLARHFATPQILAPDKEKGREPKPPPWCCT